MKGRILVSGSVAIDRIMVFQGLFADHIVPEKLHVLNVSFAVDTLRESFGGTGGNISYTLARLGLRPTLLSSAGSDSEVYRQHLRAAGVDCSALRVVSNRATATATIMTDQADNQITGFYPGALLAQLSPASVPSTARLAIVSPGNLADMERLPALYRRRGIPFFFDPGQQIVRLSAAALKNGIRGSLGLLGNDYEIALIMKKTRLSKKALLSSAKTVVTTLGPKGSMIETGTSRQRIAPAKPIKVVDPTGAGDAFRAGLLFGLFHGWTMKKAAQFGSVTAVYAVEFYGTQVPKLTRTSAFTRYYRTFGERV